MALASGSEYEAWPGNALDAARKGFGWLTAGPHPVAVDGRLFDHLPNREIPVDELRDQLLQRGCPRRVWDQVWTHVISRARVEGATWTIVAVGLALPMLTPLAARLTERYADDPGDIHAEILRGFLDALRAVDLAEGRIAIRLRWAAYRAGHRALITAMDGPTPKSPSFHFGGLTPASGHPDLVLARAVEAGVLTRTEAELIGATRLDGIELADWPQRTELSYEGLRSVRRRAESRLVAWVTETAPTSDEGDPTNGAAISRLSPGGLAAGAIRSRTVAKTGCPVLTDARPNSGLQGCE